MQKNREIRGIRKKQLAKLVWLLFHFLCLLSHWLPEALRQSRCIPTRSSICSSRTPGFVDQGGRGLVQSGSGWLWDARWGGEGGRQAGGWAPLGSAHCWSGAVFQQRRHLCCAHRLSRPKGTPVAAPNGSASATEAQKSAHFTLPASHSPLAARPHSKFTKLVCDALMERHCKEQAGLGCSPPRRLCDRPIVKVQITYNVLSRAPLLHILPKMSRHMRGT